LSKKASISEARGNLKRRQDAKIKKSSPFSPILLKMVPKMEALFDLNSLKLEHFMFIFGTPFWSNFRTKMVPKSIQKWIQE